MSASTWNRSGMGRIDRIRAPYGFVPVSPHVFFPGWAGHVSMDRPLAQGISGTVPYEVQAETPIFVRGTARPDSFAQLPDQTYAIPGTSVRGCVRNVLEIASFAKLSLFNDRRYGVRDLHNRALYGDHMATIYNGQPTPLVTAGWLVRRPGDEDHPAEIRPCHFAKIEYALLEQFARSRGKRNYDPGRKKKSAPEKYRQWLGLDPRDSKSDRHVTTIPEFDAELRVHVEVTPRRVANPGAGWLGDYGEVESAGKGGAQPGQLVFTGQPGAWMPNQPKRRGAGNAKHHDFVFYGESGRAIPVGRETLRDFQFIHSNRGEQHRADDDPNPEWAFWKPRFEAGLPVPVFFLLEVDGRGLVKQPFEVRSFGLAMMFRLAYRLSIRQAVKNAQPACDDTRPDLPEVFFGRTPDEGRDRGQPASDRRQGFKGRVSFGLARAEGKPAPLGEVRAVLGAPKPSYYPCYIRQPRAGKDGARTEVYTTLMDPSAQVRGWKRYRPQRAQLAPPLPPQAKSDKIYTTFRPLPQGTRFTGKLRLHNVLPQELGALLWACSLGGAKDAFHGLGLAKPYGFGRVRIRIDDGALATLRQNDGTPVDPAACLRAFEEAMESFARTVGLASWRSSEPIESLLALARPIPDGSDEGRYMELDHPSFRNEFTSAKKEMLVLQPVLARQETTIGPGSSGGGGPGAWPGGESGLGEGGGAGAGLTTNLGDLLAGVASSEPSLKSRPVEAPPVPDNPVETIAAWIEASIEESRAELEGEVEELVAVLGGLGDKGGDVWPQIASKNRKKLTQWAAKSALVSQLMRALGRA